MWSRWRSPRRPATPTGRLATPTRWLAAATRRPGWRGALHRGLDGFDRIAKWLRDIAFDLWDYRSGSRVGRRAWSACRRTWRRGCTRASVPSLKHRRLLTRRRSPALPLPATTRPSAWDIRGRSIRAFSPIHWPCARHRAQSGCRAIPSGCAPRRAHTT